VPCGLAARDTGRVRADVLDLGARPLLIIWVFDVRMITREAVPVYASSLMEAVRCHLGAAGAPPAPATPAQAESLRQVLEERLADPRKPRGIRHSLASLVSVLVAGVACGYASVLAIAVAAAGWDPEVLAAHGVRRNPRTGAHEPPSASTLGRVPALLDADELEAGLQGWIAAAALGPRLAARIAARRSGRKKEDKARRRRKPPAAEALRQIRDDGWVRAAPGHPWLDPAVTGDPGHVPARPAVAVDGKERKLAKAGGKKKVHLLGAITHVTGLVIGQDRVAKAGKANEITHFRPLLEPLPLAGVVITADAMQTQREHARWLTEDKDAYWLVPVLGNQPGLYARLDALPWEGTPVAAAATEISRGRIETRTIRVLPAPQEPGFPYARQAILIERYVTVKKNGTWVMRNCEAVLYLTSLAAADASPEDLLARIRGHWTVEHLHWLRDVIWREDKSLIRTGNAPQVMSALTNLVITAFRIQGVTRYAEETRRNAQNPRRVLQLLDLSPG
jgi:predicted transposase YbfD/YdcC